MQETLTICWNDITEKEHENLIEYIRILLSEKEDD